MRKRPECQSIEASKVVGMHEEETVNNNGEGLINVCQQY